MSTILDALRKVEQDNRERNADARARLLSSPLHTYASPTRQTPPSFLLGASLAVVGFLVGGGLVYTRLQPPAPHPSTRVSQSPQSKRLPTAPADQPAAPFVPPPKPISQPQAVAMVQRSPFVAVPHTQSVQPSPYQLTPRSEPDYVLEPLEPDFWSDPPSAYGQAAHGAQQEQTLQQADQAQRDALLMSPPSAPAQPSQASLGLLQWSPEADKRLAFIRIGNGPLTMVYEGDRVGEFTVVAIRKDSVDLHGPHGAITTLYSR